MKNNFLVVFLLGIFFACGAKTNSESVENNGTTATAKSHKNTPITIESMGLNGSIKSLEITSPDGDIQQVKTYVFDEQGILRKLIIYEGECQPEKVISYNEGAVADTSYRVTNDDCGPAISKSKSNYRADGKPLEIVYVNSADGINGYELYTYDEKGNNTKIAYCNSSKKQTSAWNYRYDERGNRIEQSYEEDSVPSSKTTYKYDAKNRLVEEKEFFGDDIPRNIEIYKYNEKGQLIEQTSEGRWGSQSKRIFTYTADGKENGVRWYDIEKGVTNLRESDTTIYHANGTRTQRIRSNFEGWHTIEGTFNKQNRLTLYKSFDEAEKQQNEIEFTYANDDSTVIDIESRTPIEGGGWQITDYVCGKSDAFGNPVEKVLGPVFADILANGSIDDYLEYSITERSTYSYYGKEQGNNFRWKGIIKGKKLAIAYTLQNNIALGEAVDLERKDYTPMRLVGTYEKSGNFLLYAFTKEGKVPFSINARIEGRMLTGTCNDDENTPVKLTIDESTPSFDMNRQADGYSSPFFENTYLNFTPKSDEIEGGYRYLLQPEGSGNGLLEINFSAAQKNKGSFSIECVGAGPNNPTAEVRGEATFYDNEFDYTVGGCDYSFRVTFCGDAAIIQGTNGNSFDCTEFGSGVSVEGIYLKTH